MTKPRKIHVALLAGLLILVVFLGFIQFKTNEATEVYLETTESIQLRENAIFSLNDWQMRSGEAEAGNEYAYLSEQELMERSQLNLQVHQMEQANQLFYAQRAAKVDVKDQVILLADATYSYQDKGDDTDALSRYTFETAASPISAENLTVLVDKASKQTEARNEPVWKATWIGAVLFIGCFTIGVLILFNLDRLATSLLQLFIKEAEAGPMLKILLGISAVMLLTSSFLVLYSVVGSIDW